MRDTVKRYRYDPTTQTIYDDLELSEYDSRLKSIVLVGPAGCGKTTWAINSLPKPILLVSDINTLKQFQTNVHKSVLFDDMSFTHIPREIQIHMVDREQPRTLKVLYGTVDMPAGVVKCFTANRFPFALDSAILRRITNLTIN